jgi:hypothetical protein
MAMLIGTYVFWRNDSGRFTLLAELERAEVFDETKARFEWKT